MCGDEHYSRRSKDLTCPNCGELLYRADYAENLGKFECKNPDCGVGSVEISMNLDKVKDC